MRRSRPVGVAMLATFAFTAVSTSSAASEWLFEASGSLWDETEDSFPSTWLEGGVGLLSELLEEVESPRNDVGLAVGLRSEPVRDADSYLREGPLM
jgi:hypothetical protein